MHPFSRFPPLCNPPVISIKLEYLSSIVFHTVLRTHSLATRTVWNTIDDRYSSLALLSNVATFLGFVCFDIFSCH